METACVDMGLYPNTVALLEPLLEPHAATFQYGRYLKWSR